MRMNPEPEDTNWARLREAQVYGTKAVKNAAAAIITDVGEENDIHPRQKGPVGERLALLALRNQYRRRIVAQGPTLRRAAFGRGKATLSFDNADGGLIAAATDSARRPVEPGRLLGFAIAGEDGKFVWAEARIVGRGQIEVSAPSVPDPRVVRFGWANFPVVNFYNGAGLPAVPFRTDRPKEKRR
jgi:sialate O-acetylesterase